MVKRYAIVFGPRGRTTKPVVEAYLPQNYRVLWEGSWVVNKYYSDLEDLVVVIGGEDKLGWTLDDYVTPRLISGAMLLEEIDLSHPIMKLF